MSIQTKIACSIAQPLLIELTTQPFVGQVLGVFNRACNLVDPHRRVITLALPEVENGPFSILIAECADLLSMLTLGQRVLGIKIRQIVPALF